MDLTRILIVEDDNDINNMLKDLLTSEGYEVSCAFSGTEALLLLKNVIFDLILLDLMLPGMTGEDVLKHIRIENKTPVIVVSARDDKESKVNLLKSGADDYITKPFDTDELLARIEAILRRNSSVSDDSTSIITYKNIIIDTGLLEVKCGGNCVSLTKIEYSILELLMGNPKKIFTKNNIFESVWNEPFLGEDNAINVHISNIRNKLSRAGGDGKYIQTVWGLGFKME